MLCYNNVVILSVLCSKSSNKDFYLLFTYFLTTKAMSSDSDFVRWRLDEQYDRLARQQRQLANDAIAAFRRTRYGNLEELPVDVRLDFNRRQRELEADITEFNEYVYGLSQLLDPNERRAYYTGLSRYIPEAVKYETHKWVIDYLENPLKID